MRCLVLAVLITLVFATGSPPRIVLSSSPIPNVGVIGEANLAAIESKPYTTREKWAQQLLNECGVLDATLALLRGVTCGRVVQTNYVRSISVTAGGFEAVTDPTFIFDIDPRMDQNQLAILDNVVAFVLSQGGNGRFTTLDSVSFPDGFPSVYLSVTFNSVISGLQATAFFETLGEINPALYSSNFAGFTQVNSGGKSTMVFISPDVPEEEFREGMVAAVALWNSDQSNPTATLDQASGVADIQVAFTWNDWVENQFGGGFFSAIADLNNGKSLSPLCISALRLVRNRALRAAANFIRQTGIPSSKRCELAPQDLVPVPPTDASIACPRNLGCDECQAAGCSFYRFRDYGVCKPRRQAHSVFGRDQVKACSSNDNKLEYPVLSQANLQQLVSARNSKCRVTSVSPTETTDNIYVAVSIGWSYAGARDPGCWDIVQEVMFRNYNGIRVTSSVSAI